MNPESGTTMFGLEMALHREGSEQQSNKSVCHSSWSCDETEDVDLYGTIYVINYNVTKYY